MANHYLMCARHRKRWSVEQAAQKVQVAEITYRRWEKGAHVPNISSLDLLCNAYEVEPEDLGYLIQADGRITLRPGEGDSLSRDDFEKPTEDLAQAQKETLESIQRSLQILAETVTHSQETSAVPKAESPLSAIPSTPQTPSSTSPQPLVSRPFFNASLQGIIGVGGANTQKLNARNLRDSYLASSPDIVGSLRAYSSLCQGNLTICQQQIDLYTIIEERRTMNDEHITDPTQITRRDLCMLAIVSPSLLTHIRRGWFTASAIEEFLSEATASVTTCWYLLQGDGLALVEFTLPQYLPELVGVVKHSSLYRQRASYLAAQGFLQRGLVALHRLHYAERVVCCREAVKYAHESGDRMLLVTSLIHTSGAFRDTGQLVEMLDTYLQAEHSSKELSGFPRSRVQAKLSLAYAKQGKSQEVIRCLGEANALFMEADDEIPFFLSADHNLLDIIQHEGRSSLDLGNHAQGQGNTREAQKYYKDAAEKFGKIEQLPSGIILPARINVEIEIGRAKAAALEGNMEEFLKRFENGVRGAKELGSEKRMQEAKEALKVAIERWPNETQIKGLWELLI